MVQVQHIFTLGGVFVAQIEGRQVTDRENLHIRFLNTFFGVSPQNKQKNDDKRRRKYSRTILLEQYFK